MNIRIIQATDNQQLAKLIRDIFEEYNAPKVGTVYSDPTTDQLYEAFQESKSILWVAEEADTILGCCGIYPSPGLPENCAELVKLYLLQSARGKGLAKLLMEKSIASAIEMGYQELYIESIPEFSKAVQIYEKLGFVKLDHPLGEAIHPTCDIWLLKKL